MPHISFTDPIPGDANSTEEPKIPTALDAIKTAINGGLGTSNLLAALAQTLLVGKQSAGTGNVWAWDVGTVTFSGPGTGLTTDSGYQVIAHQLTVVPFLVFVQAWGLDADAAPLGSPTSADPFEWTDTNVTLQARYGAGDWPSTYTVEAGWLAIGIAPDPES